MVVVAMIGILIFRRIAVTELQVTIQNAFLHLLVFPDFGDWEVGGFPRNKTCHRPQKENRRVTCQVLST
jgi:hypothetical protein